jgi:hypothetical protein
MNADSPPSGRGQSAPASGATSVSEFYDGLAAGYHLVYGDRWDEAVAQQGAALERMIRNERPSATDVLDCSCGVG